MPFVSSSDHMLEHELNSCPVLLSHLLQGTYSRSLWLTYRLYNPSCVHTILPPSMSLQLFLAPLNKFQPCQQECVVHCSSIREFAGVLLFFASGAQMFHTELKLWANLGHISVHFNIFSYQNSSLPTYGTKWGSEWVIHQSSFRAIDVAMRSHLVR